MRDGALRCIVSGVSAAVFLFVIPDSSDMQQNESGRSQGTEQLLRTKLNNDLTHKEKLPFMRNVQSQMVTFLVSQFTVQLIAQ